MLIPGALKVYVARDKTDLRKSYNGLSMLVQDVLQQEPVSGHLFVFFNRGLDKVKVLYWDKNGFCLWQKRLETGRFPPRSFDQPTFVMSFQEFQMVLGGIDLHRLPPRKEVKGCRVN